MRPAGRRRDGCPGRPIRVSQTRLHFKVSQLARPPGICETASRPLSRKLDARALDFAPLLAELHDTTHGFPRRNHQDTEYLSTRLTWTGFQALPPRVVCPVASSRAAMIRSESPSARQAATRGV